MNLPEKRRAIRHLLDETDPADAMAANYAFHHPDDKTTLVLAPPESPRASGYVALSRTGIDLFRPLMTARFPAGDLDTVADLLYRALAPGASLFINVPDAHQPLLKGLFDVRTEQFLRVYALDQQRFEPIINVLVTQSTTPDGLPRFLVRSRQTDGDVAASASLNWQSPHFAEISVNTASQYRQRGWGRSVVSALVQHLLASGRTPLYVASEQNQASIKLAQGVGFVYTGARQIFLEATLRPRPA